MRERREPEFVQFTKGEVVAGELIAMDRVMVGEPKKAATRYTVKLDNGQLAAFIGTYQIDTKLRTDDLHHRISVEYVGEDVTVKRGGNFMRVFTVLVSEQPVSRPVVDLGITDADIPF